jgi:hypothetical protein
MKFYGRLLLYEISSKKRGRGVINNMLYGLTLLVGRSIEWLDNFSIPLFYGREKREYHCQAKF